MLKDGLHELPFVLRAEDLVDLSLLIACPVLPTHGLLLIHIDTSQSARAASVGRNSVQNQPSLPSQLKARAFTTRYRVP
jgi:hypothetical protein